MKAVPSDSFFPCCLSLLSLSICPIDTTSKASILTAPDPVNFTFHFGGMSHRCFSYTTHLHLGWPSSPKWRPHQQIHDLMIRLIAPWNQTIKQTRKHTVRAVSPHDVFPSFVRVFPRKLILSCCVKSGTCLSSSSSTLTSRDLTAEAQWCATVRPFSTKYDQQLQSPETAVAQRSH